MKETYLIDTDKELAEILLWESDETKGFDEKSREDKITFIKSTMERIKVYWDRKKPCTQLIYRDDIYTLSHTFYSFSHALKIYSEDNHTILAGWHHKHGSVYLYYENDGTEIYMSYYSDGHPNKELKRKWKFAGNYYDSLFDELCRMEVTDKIPRSSAVCFAEKAGIKKNPKPATRNP